MTPPARTVRSSRPLPLLEQGIAGLRIATLDGYFAERCGRPEALRALARCATALGVTATATFPHAATARAAAYLITTTEGAALHLERLRTRAADFDPATRDRLIAGAMVPAAWVAKAQKIRRMTQMAMRELFETVDVLLAPATPCVAPRLGQDDDDGRRPGPAGARQSRAVHATDLLHRAARRRGSRVARWCDAADRRAGDRSRLARGSSAPGRARAGEIWRRTFASSPRSDGTGLSRRGRRARAEHREARAGAGRGSCCGRPRRARTGGCRVLRACSHRHCRGCRASRWRHRCR